jgi:hypothetical protein
MGEDHGLAHCSSRVRERRLVRVFWRGENPRVWGMERPWVAKGHEWWEKAIRDVCRLHWNPYSNAGISFLQTWLERKLLPWWSVLLQYWLGTSKGCFCAQRKSTPTTNHQSPPKSSLRAASTVMDRHVLSSSGPETQVQACLAEEWGPRGILSTVHGAWGGCLHGTEELVQRVDYWVFLGFPSCYFENSPLHELKIQCQKKSFEILQRGK